MVSIVARSLFFSCLLLCFYPLTAQWAVSGQVVDASSGEGLAYVNIHIDTSGLGTTSDQKGNFRIEGLKASLYGITFSMIGYQSVHMEINAPGSDPLFILLHPEIYLTNEVVVSASRKTQSLSLAPASVGLVTQSQIQSQGIQSFDDAFHSVNGVQVTRSSGSNVQALSIRGASDVAGGGIGNRVLLLLDGRPAITPESGGALWNLVPLGAVERIEVIKGAYSSLFGSSAMGGIINVITKTPDTLPQTSIDVSYGFHDQPPAYADYTLYNDFYSLGLTHSATQGRWSYVLNGHAHATDGHREKTAYTTYSGFGKVLYHFSPNRSFQFSAMYNDIFNDTPATWLSILQPYHVATHRKDDTQHRRELNTDLHYIAYAHARVKYSARFYYYGNLTDYIFNGDPANDSTNINKGRQYIDEEKVIVHRLGHATQLDFSLGESHYLIGGLELQSDYIDGRPDTVLYGRHKAWNIGAYIQDQWTHGPWIVTGGIRFDQYKIINTFSEGNFSPKIAAVFQASKKVSLRALVARAFRNPSISERFTKFEQGGGLKFLPNPDLRSEKLNLSAEAGVKFTVGKDLRADMSLFYNHYKDLIYFQQRPAPGDELLFEVINLSKAIMQGYEVSLEYAPFKWMQWHAGYTYLDARDASDQRFNDVLPYKSKHTGYLNLSGSFKKINYFFQARGRSRIDEVFIYPGSEPDGYLLFNTRISYDFLPNVSAYAGINNISNKQYEEIERYRMEGRTYSFGIKYNVRTFKK